MVESDGRDSGDVVRAAVDEAYKWCSYVHTVRCDMFGKKTRRCFSPAEVMVGSNSYCKLHVAKAARVLFRDRVGPEGSARWLDSEELLRVVTGEDPANRFIGGVADSKNETVTFMRGDFQAIVVPFSCFEPSGDGVKPDFSQLSFADYGHTVVLGEYEASTDAILCETEGEHRPKEPTLDVVRAAVDEAYKFGRCAYTYAVRCERFGKAYRQCGSPAEVAVGASMYCKQHAAGAASALLRLSSYGRDPA